jgi:hypothetical protein
VIGSSEHGAVLSGVDAGLCLTCRWMRVVTNRRGSVFYRCARAETDPRFVRYPPLPVLACPGYEETEATRAGSVEP